ncbi:unnamed protein product [Phytomonas sp. EM1]|nr:unnamed protein product [Phytomonas sp. EM1]|eukprot:CCW62879.1 unnamed protein product [Phytomonas sp. isolate EM1]
MDALLDHIEAAHADDGGADALTEAEWESLCAIEHTMYGKSNHSVSEITAEEGVNGGELSPISKSADKSAGGDDGIKLEGEGRADQSVSSQLPAVDSSVNGANTSTKTEGNSASPASVDGDQQSLAFPSLAGVPEHQVSVHSRMAVEVVLLGIVRHIQYGILPESVKAENNGGGYTQVLQIVLGVESPLPPSCAAYLEENIEGRDSRDGSVVPDEGSSTSQVKSARPQGGIQEEELVVVRCLNACNTLPLTLLQQQLHIGCRAYVEGVLKMNRHVDDISRRSHAYPYVRVVPPQGSIVVL